VRVGTVSGSPDFGTATYSVEVFNPAVGPEGLSVSAVWPVEGVTRTVVLVPAHPPTPNGTVQPLPPTNTPVPPTTTPTATSTPTGTTTPVPTNTPTPQPLTASACFEPSILQGAALGGEASSLMALTNPGAQCSAQIAYLDRSTPAGFDGGPVPVGSSGMVQFPFTENSESDGGLGRVTCTLGNQSASTCAGFVILHPNDAALTTSQQADLLAPITQIAQDPQRCAQFFGA
jgi:hypothetical protein